MIKDLHREENRWFWRTENNQGVYYTDKNGQGIFYQSDKTGEEKQLAAHASSPPVRRKAGCAGSSTSCSMESQKIPQC